MDSHDEGPARSGRPLRAPDPALEPEDEAVHLRQAQRDLHPRPAEDRQTGEAGVRLRRAAWAARAGTLLFVGTKRQAQEAISEEATRAGQSWVTHRWLGGTLTNFVTIRALARAPERDRGAVGRRRQQADQERAPARGSRARQDGAQSGRYPRDERLAGRALRGRSEERVRSPSPRPTSSAFR